VRRNTIADIGRLATLADMRRTGYIVVGIVTAGGILLSLPIWGMGIAAFIDARRSVVSSHQSPDERRIAQVERLVVGGVPSIVVTVRRSWMPNWYISSCAAASHYGETTANVRWTSAISLEVSSGADPQHWFVGAAPFHSDACPGLIVSAVKG
jgi:hypothetical protein